MKILTKKEQKEALMRIAANHIIAQDVANRLHDTTEMSVEEYVRYIDKLIENTVHSARLIGGEAGMSMVRNIVESKFAKYKPYNL